MVERVFGFNEKDVNRVSGVIRAYEKGAGPPPPLQGPRAHWPAPWDVGAGNEDVDLRPASDTQTTARAGTWSLGDGTFVERRYRYAWDTTNHLLLGFYWDVRHDAYGRVVAVTAETKYTVNTAEPC